MVHLLDQKDAVICAKMECINLKDCEIKHIKDQLEYLPEMRQEIERLKILVNTGKEENKALKKQINKHEEEHGHLFRTHTGLKD